MKEIGILENEEIKLCKTYPKWDGKGMKEQ